MRLAPSVSGQNADRITRLFARFISVGYLAYLGILSPSIALMASRMDSWWTPVALAVVFGSGLLPGVLSLRADIRLVRWSSAVAAIAFLMAVVSWPSAWNGPDLPAHDGVWLAGFPGLASLAAAIAWTAPWTFTHLVIACIGVQQLNFIARDDARTAMLVPEILFSIMFCTLFVGGAVMALRTGRLLDTTKDEAHAAAAAAAAERARTVERERFDALTHDNVMATLLAAARSQSQEHVSSLAETTLGLLDRIRSGAGSDKPFSLDRALTHWRAAATEADERSGFYVDRNGALESIPADSTRALGSALAEAVRNSRLHAGPAASCTVTVAINDNDVTIHVEDDGTGFDPSSVAPHRLGIAVSILTQMSRLPGGSAYIDTRPGSGTTVRLGWCRQ